MKPAMKVIDWRADEHWKRIEGKVITDVTLSLNAEKLRLEFADGKHLVLRAYGECCSSTWIEHLEVPRDVVGARVTAARELEAEGPGDDVDGECIRSYQTVIGTDRGDISIEYRNGSNGYYGGSLEVVDEETSL